MIRAANPGDAEAMGVLHVRCWKDAYRGIIPDSVLDDENAVGRRQALWRSEIEDDTRKRFVADKNGELVGFASGGPHRDADAGPKEKELMAIYVVKEEWGSGVGKQLYDALINAIRETDVEAISLWVLADNPRA